MKPTAGDRNEPAPQQPTDRELLAAVERAKGVERGRAMYRARYAVERLRDPTSNVAKGRDMRTSREKR